MLRFTILGVVTDRDTGIPLPGLFVKAYDNTIISTTNYGMAISAGHDLASSLEFEAEMMALTGARAAISA